MKIFIFLGVLLSSNISCQILSQDEKDYISKFIHPISSYEPDYSDQNDLKFLDNQIVDQTMVAIGESSHGSREVTKMKDRLSRFLIENKNFRNYALEAGLPESDFMNEYIINSKNDAKTYLETIGYWIYKTQEHVDGINWMKKFNEKSQQKIHFMGFDMQNIIGIFQTLKQTSAENKWPESYANNIYQSVVLALKANKLSKDNELKLNSEIDAMQQQINTLSDEKKKQWLSENITVLKQFLHFQFKSFTKSDDRDRYMAENAIWLNHYFADSKMILSGHNGHIGTPDNRYKIMGDYLKKEFGDRYTTFGFAIYKGTFSANGKQGMGTYTLQEAPKNSLEYLLNSFGKDLFILDLKSIRKENNPLAKLLFQEIKVRGIGYETMSNDFKSTTNPVETYDYIIFIKNSTNTNLIK